MYDAVSHEHLDSLVYWATGEFPDASLCLVECADGRWFIEVDHGVAFDHIQGVSRPKVTPFIEPAFFSSGVYAREFAFTCIKGVYPIQSDKDLSDYFAEDDDE